MLNLTNFKFRYTTNPGYGDLVVDSLALMVTLIGDTKQRVYEDFKNIFCPSSIDLMWSVVLALFFTLLRHLFQNMMCQSVIKHLKLDVEQYSRKLPESSWKLLVYCCLWSYCYLILAYKYDYLSQPMSIWDDWSLCMSIPWDVRLLYCAECGFYLHSIYATLYMDEKRKDFVVMLCHHVLTLVLIVVSFMARYHKIGIMIIFTHDVTDILLEMTKCHVYLQKRSGKDHKVHDLLSKIGFVAFALAWFLFRLYWFPLKLLYTASAASGHRAYQRDAAWYALFNLLLWSLLAMDVYWFYFVLLFLYKIATKQLKELSDTREYEADGHQKDS